MDPPGAKPRRRKPGGPSRGRGRGRGGHGSQARGMHEATNFVDGSLSYGREHVPRHNARRGRGNHSERGKPFNPAMAKRNPLPATYFTRDDINELASADDETVVRRINQNENGFLKAFEHDKFLEHPRTLKHLVKILYSLVESDENATASRVLNSIFGAGNKYASFLVWLSQLCNSMPFESKEFIREENLKALFHLTKIGTFCIEKIPQTAVRTFPVQSIKSTTEKLLQNCRDNEFTLTEIEQHVLELDIRFDSFQEEQQRPKPVLPQQGVPEAEQEPPEHFTTLAILPAPEEIYQFAKKPFLRRNIVKGNYRSWDHYIDVQFRLLREDFVGPLRAGISEHLEGGARRGGGDVRVYRKVKIQQPVCLASGVGFEISFEPLGRVNWEYTKRLINGSLLCLSTDMFETIAFASVAQRETKQLHKGIVTVKFEGSTNGFQMEPRAVYTMVESVAYFEAYRHVLEKLQGVSQGHEIDTMPFQEYIVDCAFEDIPLPPYLKFLRRKVFDLEGIIDITSRYVSSRVNLSDVSSWPDASDTDLDLSQMNALKAALTQELSVIQGPPGTGKTYVGMKIVQSFLSNRNVWDPLKTSPILVVCYTNHALDQFLEGIRSTPVHGKEPNITRIGGRCKTENLKNCTLYEKVSKAREARSVPRTVYKEFAKAKTSMVGCKNRIIEHLKTIHQSRNKILPIDILRQFMTRQHAQQLYTLQADKPIEVWLGLQYSNPNDDYLLADGEKNEDNLQQIRDEAMDTVNDEDDDNEVQMLHDDRLVEGNEVLYRAPDEDMLQAIDSGPDKKEAANDGWTTVQMGKKKRQKLIRKQLTRGLKPMRSEEVRDIYDLWLLETQQKWKLYLFWRDSFVKLQTQQLERLSDSYKMACKAFQECKQEIDHSVVQGSDVVGMTTTGAAKHNHIIKAIKPKIVVVEEAAEIFEPHIFTSLSPSVQQLILIGDHQQLRPKPTCYDLETKYDFNVSLFERLALNGCPVQSLRIQHRMRPEIASLITPSVYAELYNHESVENYGFVQGVGKSLYFVDHAELEVSGNDDRKSHSNPHEARFLVALCDYLLKQGYDQSEITMLTLYRGQLIEIKKNLKQRNITGVRTAVVDDFQGEENEIILLSLVRSNREQRIGFVGIANRVCVALSRAKKGLYICGNLSMLRDKVATIWPKVIDQLSTMEAIGESLPLHCHVHPDQTVNAKTSDDFLKCPEGGCQKKCDARLICGHVCRRMCHPYDREHEKYKCFQKCSKTLSCGHECKRKCHECSTACKPCKEKVSRLLPRCGHTAVVLCSDNLVDVSCPKLCGKPLPCGHFCQENCSMPCTVQCNVVLDKKLSCGHTVQDACYLRPSSIDCSEPCTSMLDCEHPCTGTCSTCKRGRLHVKCNSKCDRQLMCGHICDFPCTPNCPPCTKPCTNFCNHSRCPKKCFEPCPPCKERCSWSCIHYNCSQPCGSLCDRPPCDHPCPKRLKCGHKCIGLCGELCPKLCRVCNKEEVTDVFFGDEEEEDARFVLLPDCDHIFEVGGLDKWMSSDCDESQQVALKPCPRCKTPVRKCLRYGNEIKMYLRDVEEIKQKQVSVLQSIDLRTELTQALSCQNSRSIVEELAVIEKAVARDSESGRTKFIMFPYVVKAQLILLTQVAKVTEIVSSIDQLPIYRSSARQKHEIKRELHFMKRFVMVDFLSQQQITDAETEMRRLTVLAKLIEFQHKLASKFGKLTNEEDDSLKLYLLELDLCGLKTEKVSPDYEAKILNTLSILSQKYSVHGLTDTERLEIVKAVGLEKGHWYKCPNGHFYCIGECGGAMETSKCPECEANIGGTRHTLVAGNQHAPEMDGSRHAAWSDAANMDMFDPQELARLRLF